MPRPRFEHLDPARKATILRTAAKEFAEHGFEGASYNLIIERSGLSKGVMYYYFDDKEDLYLTVLKDALARLMTEVGELPSPKNALEFWRSFEAMYERCLHLFQNDPTALGLGRSLIKTTARGNSTALNEVRQLARDWMESLIKSGQEVGAIRNDLPEGLLISVLVALEEGIDLWLAEQLGGLSQDQLRVLSVTLTALFQRVAAPREFLK